MAQPGVTMRLGAIFAGGMARRFGGDKAAAEIGGVALIDRVATALAPQVDALVIVGREWSALPAIPDRPAPGLGPLGALAGALGHARDTGFDEVLTSGCDLPDLPDDLIQRLAPAPAVIAGQPLVGLWPVTFADRLLEYLERTDDRSMRGWIAAAGARRIAYDRPLANINTPAELAAFVSSSADRRSSP